MLRTLFLRPLISAATVQTHHDLLFIRFGRSYLWTYVGVARRICSAGTTCLI